MSLLLLSNQTNKQIIKIGCPEKQEKEEQDKGGRTLLLKVLNFE